MNATVFSGKIVEWYREHHRSLPWRRTRDPYKIWLSEIILQQTRVAQGLPYYRALVKRFPTVHALAAAPEREVLRVWQGLGYYSRARNLRTCARTVVKDFRGKFPGSFAELKKLKGIGDYTAAAIASFAFHEPVAAVDGNVSRVLSRLFGVTQDIASAPGKKKITELANSLLSPLQPALHNQAMMEFGALQCTPRNPLCDECIFSRECVANRKGLQRELPVKRKPVRQTHRYFHYLVVRRGPAIALRRRTGTDIWKGLYEFPLVEADHELSLPEIGRKLSATIGANVKFTRSPVLRHVLSHQTLHIRFMEIQLPAGIEFPGHSFFDGAVFYSPHKAQHLPKPVPITDYLAESVAG